MPRKAEVLRMAAESPVKMVERDIDSDYRRVWALPPQVKGELAIASAEIDVDARVLRRPAMKVGRFRTRRRDRND